MIHRPKEPGDWAENMYEATILFEWPEDYGHPHNALRGFWNPPVMTCMRDARIEDRSSESGGDCRCEYLGLTRIEAL